jgi:hypothetical protein
MQKAIRNTSGKPVQVESLDKRLDAREKTNSKPTVAVQSVHDKKAAASAAADKLDRDYQANKAAQAKSEAHQGTADDKTTEFKVRENG